MNNTDFANRTKRPSKAISRKKTLRGVVFLSSDRIIDPVVTAEGDRLLKELFNPTDPGEFAI